MSSPSTLRVFCALCFATVCICFGTATVFADDGEVLQAVEVGEEDVIVEMDEVDVVFEEAMAMDMEMGLDINGNPVESKLKAYVRRQRVLVSLVCELDDVQKKQLDELDDKWVQEKIKQSVERPEQEVRVVQPNLIARFFGAQPRPINRGRGQPFVDEAAVRSTIDEAITGILTQEQEKLLDDERLAAERFQHEATADAVIECLSTQLNVRDEQREPLKTKLIPWLKNRDMMMSPYFSGNQYVPSIPSHLLDGLDKEQLKIYGGLQQVSFSSESFNNGETPIVIKP
ncbi:hypothetical protein [Stieleria varia]|uniref:Secreted protein n=1 Tax=Stieleria varia TaxID=2528005 RepID=A0A5C6AP28_9BACT|nr:hypothetical protein [Stieleria varia]TWU00772.1 hypothetical protein Pla52n_41410 [Stieleria varia]